MSKDETAQQLEGIKQDLIDVELLQDQHEQKYGARLRALRDEDGAPLDSELVNHLLKISMPYRMMIEQRQAAAPLKGSKAKPDHPGVESYYKGLKAQAESLLASLQDVRMDAPIVHFDWGSDSRAVLEALHLQTKLRVNIADQLSELLKQNQLILVFLKSHKSLGAKRVSSAERSY